MSPLAVSIVAAIVVVGQVEGGPGITGIVVDASGKPVSAAEIRLSCGMARDGTTPSLGATQTDTQGRFRLAVPPRERLRGLSWYSAVWAYRPDKALACQTVVLMQKIGSAPLRLVLRDLSTRTVTARGPAGQPVEGVRVTPRSLHGAESQMGNDMIPDDLALRFAATTGADGKAMLKFLAPRDDLVAVRVASGAIGAGLCPDPNADLPNERPGGICDRPQADRVLYGPDRRWRRQTYPRHSRRGLVQGSRLAAADPVQLPGEPLRTAADGTFRTPPSLWLGSSYRVVVQVPGSELILSDWLTAGERPLNLPPLMLRTLRTISGRVTDRQGRPIGGAEVFQAGDGPELTSTRTDFEGRFSLGGFRAGPVFLFARGRLSLPRPDGRCPCRGGHTRNDPRDRAAREVDGDGARADRPGGIMALAHQLIEPYVKFAVDKGNDSTKFWALNAIVAADPLQVLEQLDSIKFEKADNRELVRNRIVRSLARTDVDEAMAVAESIADAGQRAGTLVDLADSVPATDRARKLSILALAALQARAAPNVEDRLLQMGEVAERWFELGEIEPARNLFALGRTLADQFADKSSFIRGLFAVRLSRVDLPAALAIVKEVRGARQAECLGEIAGRLAALNPAEAERIVDGINDPLVRVDATLRICLRMATVDPAARAADRGADSGSHLPRPSIFVPGNLVEGARSGCRGRAVPGRAGRARPFLRGRNRGSLPIAPRRGFAAGRGADRPCAGA